MIQELRGPWSALEDLGKAIGQRAVMQRNDQEVERERAKDRVSQLMQLAQAGLLPEGTLEAQAAQDLAQFGLQPSSVFALNDQTKADRQRKREAEDRDAAQKAQVASANIARDRAAATLDQARAKALGIPEPEKAPNQGELDRIGDTIVEGLVANGMGKVKDAYEFARTHPVLSRLSDANRKVVVDAAVTRMREKKATKAGGEDETTSRLAKMADYAIAAARAGVDRPDGASDADYRMSVLGRAWDVLKADPRAAWAVKQLTADDLLVAYQRSKTTTEKTADQSPKAPVAGGALGILESLRAGKAGAIKAPAPKAGKPTATSGSVLDKYGVR